MDMELDKLTTEITRVLELKGINERTYFTKSKIEQEYGKPYASKEELIGCILNKYYDI